MSPSPMMEPQFCSFWRLSTQLPSKVLVEQSTLQELLKNDDEIVKLRIKMVMIYLLSTVSTVRVTWWLQL